MALAFVRKVGIERPAGIVPAIFQTATVFTLKEGL
ncbi:hypothetical protein SAMN05216597_3179 [Pseudomonas cannabina]|nr:hypothetical protein SAMN05216597_3179 [Pseudomonas cannabina]